MSLGKLWVVLMFVQECKSSHVAQRWLTVEDVGGHVSFKRRLEPRRIQHTIQTTGKSHEQPDQASVPSNTKRVLEHSPMGQWIENLPPSKLMNESLENIVTQSRHLICPTQQWLWFGPGMYGSNWAGQLTNCHLLMLAEVYRSISSLSRIMMWNDI